MERDPASGDMIANYIGTQRYTSLGPFYDPSSIVDFLNPVLSTLTTPLGGYSWKGKELLDKNGNELDGRAKWGVALTDLLETYFYPSQWIHGWIVGGKPSDASSLIPGLGNPARDYRFYGYAQSLKRVESAKQAKSGLIFNPDVAIWNPFKTLSGTVGSKKYQNDSSGSLLDGSGSKSGGTSLLGTKRNSTINAAGEKEFYIDPEMRKKQKTGKGTSLLD
jgi:hypothetical protein